MNRLLRLKLVRPKSPQNPNPKDHDPLHFPKNLSLSPKTQPLGSDTQYDGRQNKTTHAPSMHLNPRTSNPEP